MVQLYHTQLCMFVWRLVANFNVYAWQNYCILIGWEEYNYFNDFPKTNKMAERFSGLVMKKTKGIDQQNSLT